MRCLLPGQASLQGNESEDKLAGLATISEGQPLGHADISNLKDIGKVENFGGKGINIEVH